MKNKRTHRQKEGRTDVTKVIVAFRDYSKELKVSSGTTLFIEKYQILHGIPGIEPGPPRLENICLMSYVHPHRCLQVR